MSSDECGQIVGVMINLPNNPIAGAISDYPAVHTLKTLRLSVVEVGRPISLTLSWWIECFADPAANIEGVKVSGFTKPADTHILITSRTLLDNIQSIADIEAWIAATAWCLGAGYIYRWWRDPSNRDPGHDFGGNQYVIDGEPLVKGTAPRSDMIESAKKYGYWSWECNVSYGGRQANPYFARWREKDPSLLSDGSRTVKMPDWTKIIISPDLSINNCRRSHADGDEVHYDLVAIAIRKIV